MVALSPLLCDRGCHKGISGDGDKIGERNDLAWVGLSNFEFSLGIQKWYSKYKLWMLSWYFEDPKIGLLSHSTVIAVVEEAAVIVVGRSKTILIERLVIAVIVVVAVIETVIVLGVVVASFHHHQ